MTEYFQGLSDRFGSDLEILDREQKLILTITLVTYMWQQEYTGFTSSLEEVWKKTLASFSEIIDEPWDGPDEEFEECLSILQGISVANAGLIARRLLDQCLTGNASKLRHEEFADALIAKGFPEELAKKAAEAMFIVPHNRATTEEEYNLVIQARDFLNDEEDEEDEE